MIIEHTHKTDPKIEQAIVQLKSAAKLIADNLNDSVKADEFWYARASANAIATIKDMIDGLYEIAPSKRSG